MMSRAISWSCLRFFFSSRRRHTRLQGDWSSDVCSSDLLETVGEHHVPHHPHGLEGAEQLCAELGVALHRHTVLEGQRATSIIDLLPELAHPDVVNAGGEADEAHRRLLEAELPRQRAGEPHPIGGALLAALQM